MASLRKAKSLVISRLLLFGVAIWRAYTTRKEREHPQPDAAFDDSRRRNLDVEFEHSDWSIGPVALIYAGTLGLLAASAVVLVYAYPQSLHDVGRTLRVAPPGPNLETNPSGDLRRFYVDEDMRLNSFYWIDKSKGIIHIPIEREMEKLAKSGIPGFPGAAP